MKDEGPKRRRKLRDGITELLADYADLTRRQAVLNARLVDQLTVERKGPTPAGPARVIALRVAG